MAGALHLCEFSKGSLRLSVFQITPGNHSEAAHSNLPIVRLRTLLVKHVFDLRLLTRGRICAQHAVVQADGLDLQAKTIPGRLRKGRGDVRSPTLRRNVEEQMEVLPHLGGLASVLQVCDELLHEGSGVPREDAGSMFQQVLPMDWALLPVIAPGLQRGSRRLGRLADLAHLFDGAWWPLRPGRFHEVADGHEGQAKTDNLDKD
mmetsp:Transcript_171053/g.548147  ORF Transcript_171053/g.548147 Transcript_171053/m.548147 type:complete len:204 (+) Transcript_171053:2949-3560(+)